MWDTAVYPETELYSVVLFIRPPGKKKTLNKIEANKDTDVPEEADGERIHLLKADPHASRSSQVSSATLAELPWVWKVHYLKYKTILHHHANK